jgi:acyl-CoA reductase-like NAD-dependent aldehyde dehydrogenase
MTPGEALAALRAAEARDGAPNLKQRRALLAALARAVMARSHELMAVLDAEYEGRAPIETLLADVLLVADAARYARRNLWHWMRPRRVSVPYPFWPARAREEFVPKGVIGIMAPWNYPMQLALLPAIDAIAAGNRVCVKPSEALPRTAALIADILHDAWGDDIALCVQGDAEVGADFAAQAWDHLVFTGSTATGRKIMAAAAPNLTPLTLELGGKCPVLVLPGADLKRAAGNVLAGKAFNAGQTCVAPDTVLLIGHSRQAFIDACRETGIGLPETGVINAAQLARLRRLMAGASLTPLAEDGPGRRMALTLAEAPPEAAICHEEIFGPILLMREETSLETALAWVAAHPAPLAIYLFGATQGEENQVARIARGSAIIAGRTVEFAGFQALGFGGSGESGFGRRNGLAGFLEFSHRRASVHHGNFSLSRLFDQPRGKAVERLKNFLAK